MSRCFPFPPPGYDNKAISERLDLLPKEKRKEKKHKKEKRDREKREGKEKDRDKSKHKNKEKKDRKEKHKDKKRGEKDKDKDRKNRDDGFEGQTQSHREAEITNSICMREEVYESKYTEELDRRLRDEGAAHTMVDNFTGLDQRRAGVLATIIEVEKEQINGKQTDKILVGREQRRNDEIGQPVEKDPDKMIKAKEKAKGKEANDRKGGGHGERDREEKRSNGKDSGRHKKDVKEKVVREKDDRRHKENTVKSVAKRDQEDGLNFKPLAPHRENEKHVSSDGNTKRMNFEMNGFLHDDVRPNKMLRLPTSSHTENGRTSEPTNICTPRSIEHATMNNIKTQRVLDNKGHKINGAAAAAGTKNNIRTERVLDYKGHKINGVASSDLRPSVVSKAHVNGEAEAKPISADSRPAIISKTHQNGEAGAQRSSADPRPSIVPKTCQNGESSADPKPSVVSKARRNGESSCRPPHPDLKYLGAIYTVPTMEEWAEADDQEWLVRSDHPRIKPKAETEAGDPPQVWAKALRIESADVIALPYVIPY